MPLEESDIRKSATNQGGQVACASPALFGKVIIYHDDADGRCAAALAARLDPGQDITFIPVDYDCRKIGDLNKLLRFPDGGYDVWLVDFSFPLEEMLELQRRSRYFFWFDHHITALNGLKSLRRWRGLRRDGTAGCMLVWEYMRPGEAAPWPVRFIADRDVWLFKYGDNTRYFYEAYLAFPDTGPASDFWDVALSCRECGDLAGSWAEHMIERGHELRAARINQLRFTARWLGRPVRMNLHAADGHVRSVSSLIMNYPGSGDMGEVVRSLGYDVAWCYVQVGTGDAMVWKHSLYSDTVDVSAICARAGGGGHKGAAGYTEHALSLVMGAREFDIFLDTRFSEAADGDQSK